MRLLTVCGDPGGAAAVAMTLRAARLEPEISQHPYAYNEGVVVLARNEIAATVLSGAAQGSQAAAVIRDVRPNVVLTATSHNGINWEKHFIRAARTAGIPSAVVLESWANYDLRFSDLEFGSIFPDAVYVPDEEARVQALQVGVPAESLQVTGNPAADVLADVRDRSTADQRRQRRQDLGVKTGERLVVFLSQPHSAMPAVMERYGYDETQVLRMVLRGVRQCASDLNETVRLVVRPHPRESPATFAWLGAEENVSVVVDGDGHELVLSADAVVGMTSALLVDAALLGCRALSVQPGLQGRDTLPSFMRNSEQAVYEEAALMPALVRLLKLPPSSTRHLSLDSGAAGRVLLHLQHLSHPTTSEP